MFISQLFKNYFYYCILAVQNERLHYDSPLHAHNSPLLLFLIPPLPAAPFFQLSYTFFNGFIISFLYVHAMYFDAIFLPHSLYPFSYLLLVPLPSPCSCPFAFLDLDST
jgi:hypothetical protein